MSALAYSHQQEDTQQPQPRAASPRRVYNRARNTNPDFRKLPAFPGEELFFEAKPIDNSMVVRADDPKQRKSSWRALGAVVTGSLIFTGLLLPGAYRMVAGKQVHELRAEQDQLRREIAELRALEARHTNLQTLEKVAKTQHLIDPPPEMVQHLTPKGSYAFNQNSLPSGK